MSTSLSTKVITGFVLVAFLVIGCTLSGSYLGPITGRHLPVSTLFFISRMLFWLSLVVLYLYVEKIEKQPLLLWPEKTYSFKFFCQSVFIILLCVIAGSVIVGIAVHFLGLKTGSNAVKTMLNFGIPLKLLIIVTAAVTEEIIFRGYLMPRLQLFFKNKYWPIIISTLLFGLAHFRYGTVINVVVPCLIGFIFGWYYQKYRNLKVLIVCHFIIDFSSLILFHK